MNNIRAHFRAKRRLYFVYYLLYSFGKRRFLGTWILPGNAFFMLSFPATLSISNRTSTLSRKLFYLLQGFGAGNLMDLVEIFHLLTT